MKDFIDYLREENVIEKLLNFYKIKKEAWDREELFRKVIRQLESSSNNLLERNLLGLPLSTKDYFGSVYETILNKKERRSLGQFYTPNWIVKYIFKAIDYKYDSNIENKKLIDISCGSGSFIIHAVRILVSLYFRTHKLNQISELSVDRAKSIISNINDYIYGVDVNPIACILCQINMHYVLFGILRHIRKIDNTYAFPFFNIKYFNAFDIRDNYQYDYVVGNPPYLFIRDIPIEQREFLKSKDLETTVGQYDYYQIFIELGMKILKNHGLLGFIVPDSLLALSNRSILRKYIYNTSKIREIYYVGPKFEDPVVSNIILILEKENDKKIREKNQIKVRFVNGEENIIHQDSLPKQDFKFLINLTMKDEKIIKYLKKEFPTLRQLMEDNRFKISLGRGVELSKSGEIIYCESCVQFLPIPKRGLICPQCKNILKENQKEKIIYNSIPTDNQNNFKMFIYAINRYLIKEYKYIDVSKEGVNYKEFDIYYNRIIIRQLSQNNYICAAYDSNLSLTSQSFYNLKIGQSTIREFDSFFLLGIINSTLLSYYFIKSFGSYKKLFPRILIENIKKFPIKIPESDQEKKIASKIIENVKSLLYADRKNSEINVKIEKEIDDFVFALYKISNPNKEYILDFMRSVS
ncbi:MAG: N-6 DNA methylase [Candidatus Thorarchaeota archaeon]